MARFRGASRPEIGVGMLEIRKAWKAGKRAARVCVSQLAEVERERENARP